MMRAEHSHEKAWEKIVKYTIDGNIAENPMRYSFSGLYTLTKNLPNSANPARGFARPHFSDR